MLLKRKWKGYISQVILIKKINNLLHEQQGKKTWEIISNLVNNFKGNNITYIFIFDQFKSTNLDHDIYNSLLKSIKNTNIKFIVCSSINDLEIKTEYRKTISKYKGNPKSLDEESQEYYFYFISLYNQACKAEEKFYSLLELFGFFQKYQNLLCGDLDIGNIKGKIDEIDAKIEEKLKQFNSTSLSINLQEINLYDSLITILELLDKDLDYKNIIYYFDILPLKYFYLEFKSNCFQIHYLFEYIIIFIKKNIKM